MIPRRTVLTGAASLAALAACGPRKDGPAGVFPGLVDDWTSQIARDDPEFATRVGLDEAIAGAGYRARLADRSAIAEETRRSAALRRLAELRAIDRASLPDEEATTYDILSNVSEGTAAAAAFSFGRFSPLGAPRPYALNPLDAAFTSLPDFFDSVQPVANAAEAELYAERVRATPAALDAETQRCVQDAEAGIVPPDFAIDRTLAGLDYYLSVPPEQSPYVDALRRKIAALNLADGADRARCDRALALALAQTRDAIYPAMRRAHAALRGVRARATHDAGVWRNPDGEAFYRAALRLDTTIDRAPDDIHAQGLARVEQLTGELDIALRQVGMGEGGVGARLRQLTADPQYRYAATEEGRAALIADVDARVARVLAQANQWFAELPRATVEVRRVPLAAEAAQPGAYYQAPSLDASRPGIYYINLRDLSEMTKIDLPTQDYHEAVPGHHFQSALAQQQTELPLLRRLIGFTAFTEGWGLYAEQLVDEEGLYDDDRIGRIGYLRWQMWRAARLVVDTGMHHRRWTREQAIDYLANVTGDAPGVIVTEVERYCVWPGQACAYEVGRAEIARLRDLARNELGVKFDLRQFHSVVLLNGELPLPVLESLVRKWIAEKRRA